MYVPKPRDTSHVELPEDVRNLIELLAENAHEQWAAERIAQGWVHGPARDDAKKEHPCLVGYAELPDSEKVLDRRIATETIKVVMALGYSIAKREA